MMFVCSPNLACNRRSASGDAPFRRRRCAWHVIRCTGRGRVLRQLLSLALLGMAIAGAASSMAAAQEESPTAPVPAVRPARKPAPVIRVTPQEQEPTPETAPEQATSPVVKRAPRPKPASTAAQPATDKAQAPRKSTPSGETTTTTASHTAPKSSVSTASAVGTANGESKPAATVAVKPANPNKADGLNRTVVVLDPAHGGTDSGSRIGDTLLEKDVDLQFAFRLRSLLLARGITVVMTRDNDTPVNLGAQATPLTLDDRAGAANHARAAACLLLHATGRGVGVHLYASDLQPTPSQPYLAPWMTAQAAWVPASQGLERGVAAALGRSQVPLVSSTASVRPIDSLACPALVVELAPENATSGSIADTGYQERAAAAIAGALVVWENQVQPPVQLPRPALPVHHAAAATATTNDPAAEAQP